MRYLRFSFPASRCLPSPRHGGYAASSPFVFPVAFLLFLAALLRTDLFAGGLPPPAATLPGAVGDSPVHTILFLGDSLTAGYGLEDPATQAFPHLVSQKIAAAGHSGVRVVAAGVSGDTSAGGLRRIDWLLRQPVDVLVLELGANDGLRGVAPDETRRNLQTIIDKVRARNPALHVVVAGMRLPPSLGTAYTSAYEAVFPALARANRALLIPFLLEGVGGRPDLNQRDGIHPTAEGHRILADTVWHVLQPLL